MEESSQISIRDKEFLEKSLNESMFKLILYVGAPLALYQSFNQIFKVLDAMIASHISSGSVSAVAYLSQISSVISSLGSGLAVGAGIQISRAYGEGNFSMVKKRVSTVYAISLGIGVLILAIVLPFVKEFLRFAKTPEELIDIGASYFRLEMVTLVIVFLNNLYISVERARGNTKRLFYLNLSVIILKFGFNVFFVYILNGDLFMIGLSTLLSQLLLFGFALKNSLGRDNIFAFSKSKICLKKPVIYPVLDTAFPVVIEKMAFSMGKTIVNAMSAVYGAIMVGALGISNNIGGLTTTVQDGFKDGAGAIISQNFGAGRYKRVLDAFYMTIVINVAISSILFAITSYFLSEISYLFAGDDKVFQDMIILVYRYEMIAAIPMSINAAVLGFLYGIGKTKITLFLNFARVFIFRVPVLYFLQNFTDKGEASIGIVMMISNISSVMLAIVVSVLVIKKFKKEYHIRGELWK